MIRSLLLRRAALAALAFVALTPITATAQYKWVGPDGKVTYSDRPQQGATPMRGGTFAAAATSTAATPGGTGSLPYELRSVVQRQPVTLFVTPSCKPCDDARAHLAQRGVPHATRSISSQGDLDAFRARGFDGSLPGLEVGTQRTDGFSASGWNELLSSAGYPEKSVLPANWKAPAAQPLAPKTNATAGAAGEDPAVVADAQTADGRPADAKAGANAADPLEAASRQRANFRF